MELKSDIARQVGAKVFLLIAPLMELKHSYLTSSGV